MKHNIYLVGFMGTGKTTVSHALAKSLGFGEIDTDAQIVSQQGRSIKEIFASEGEGYFRTLETELLRQMQGQEKKVVSCGGGMVLQRENISLMKENGLVVLLTAEPETIFARVCQNSGRPLLDGKMDVAHIRELLGQRRPYYEEAGELVVRTDGRSPEEISEEIKKIGFFEKTFCFFEKSML